MMDTSAVKPPDVSYARSGDVAIAYQVVGSGPVDIVFVRGIAGDLLSTWDQPLLGPAPRSCSAMSACCRPTRTNGRSGARETVEAEAYSSRLGKRIREGY